MERESTLTLYGCRGVTKFSICGQYSERCEFLRVRPQGLPPLRETAETARDIAVSASGYDSAGSLSQEFHFLAG